MPKKYHSTVLVVSRFVTKATAYRVALIVLIALQSGFCRAEERPQYYLNDMRIMACITAENAVRAYLKDQGQVSFESCASNKFDIDLAVDDRDYQVRGYATLLSPNAGSAYKRFFVRLNHDPNSYGDWGFEVTKVEIDP
jgi:hypothetical protein